jgi:hypothetical protein
MRRLGLLVLVIVSFAVLGARADAAPGDAMIVTPNDGQVIVPGGSYTGPMQIQWNAAGSYRISLTGSYGYSWSAVSTPTQDNVGATYNYPFDAITHSGAYTAQVTNTDTEEVVAQIGFAVHVTNQASFSSPSGTVLAGSAPTATVTWTRLYDSSHTYQIRLDGSTMCSYDSLADGQTTSCQLPELESGTHEIAAVDATQGDQIAARTVTAAAHLSQRLTLSPLTFYPFVRDGYYDTTNATVTTNKPVSVRFQVKNHNGKIIRHTSTYQSEGRFTWRWAAGNDSGRKVDPGYFWIRAISTAQGETKTGDWHRVLARTVLVSRKASVSRLGVNRSSATKSSLCYIHSKAWTDHDTFVDCWGGAGASVNYNFGVPRSTYKVVTTAGTRGHCCARGTITRTTTRISSRVVQVRFHITYWRSLEIDTVHITYYYHKRL